MATDADESGASISYELTCTDCPYEATVTGDVYDALDVAESTRRNTTRTPANTS